MPDDVTTQQTTQPAAAPAAAPAPTPAPAAAPKAEDIAASLLTALDARQQRAERAVAKSFSEQYGLTDEEITAILTKAKADKAAQLPEAAQAEINKQREKANRLLITAEVRAKGSALGLVDAETAMLLLDMNGVKVDDAGNVTGVDEALNSLKTAKPFLFSAQPTGQTTSVGGRVDNTQPPADCNDVRDDIKKQLFGGK